MESPRRIIGPLWLCMKLIGIRDNVRMAKIRNNMIGLTGGWWIGIWLGFDWHLSFWTEVGIGVSLIILTICLLCIERILARRSCDE